MNNGWRRLINFGLKVTCNVEFVNSADIEATSNGELSVTRGVMCREKTRIVIDRSSYPWRDTVHCQLMPSRGFGPLVKISCRYDQRWS